MIVELLDNVKLMFPNGEWEKYTLIMQYIPRLDVYHFPYFDKPMPWITYCEKDSKGYTVNEGIYNIQV